jgi:hypothetical protein
LKKNKLAEAAVLASFNFISVYTLHITYILWGRLCVGVSMGPVSVFLLQTMCVRDAVLSSHCNLMEDGERMFLLPSHLLAEKLRSTKQQNKCRVL